MREPSENAARLATFLLRMGAGLLFMAHGTQKLFGWFGGVDQAGGTVALVSQMGAAGILETFGGALIVIGLFARPVAALLFLEMVVAYVQVHAPRALAPIQNGGELALLLGLVFLYFAGHGAGAISVDALRHKPVRRTSLNGLASERRSVSGSARVRRGYRSENVTAARN